MDMANSCTKQESHGEQFMCGDANSEMVLKFELDNYWTFPSEPTIGLQEVGSSDKENTRDPLDSLEVNCAQNVLPLLEHFKSTDVALIEMPMAHAWHPKHGTARMDLSFSVTSSSDAHSSGETAEMRDNAGAFLTTLVKGVRKDTVKVPSPSSFEGSLCTVSNKIFSSNQGPGSHMSVHKKQKKILLGDGAGNSSVSGEQCNLKYVCRKCKERFPTRKLLGGHIRKHWREAFKRTPSARWKNRKSPVPTSSTRRKNQKPPKPLARETVQSSVPVVFPTDKGKQPPVLLGSDSMRPTRMKQLVVENAAVHQPLRLDLIKRLGNVTESPSTVPDNLTKTGAAMPAPKQIPPAERCVLDLNMLPPDETDEWEP